MLPAIAAEGLADAVDAFCEGIAFSAGADRAGVREGAGARPSRSSSCRSAFEPAWRRARRALRRAFGGSSRICRRRRASRRWPEAGTVAVVLPGAFYFIREQQSPPIDAMRRHGVPIALATDSNPGTSPLTSLLLTMNMGATLVPPHRRRMHRRGDAGGGARARAVRANRKPGRRQILRSCDLGYRAAGRTGLPDGIQSASRPGVATAIPHACSARLTSSLRGIPTMTRIDNARVIRAARGTELSAKSWLTEAPMRMLMNNLDPDVAEKPSELVVYGGIGRAARDWESFDRIVATLKRLEGDRDAAGAVGQAGRRIPHPCRRAARADRQLQSGAALGQLGAFQRARSQGPDDVRPDDGRLLDLHRQPGHRSGHLRDLRRTRPPALRRRPLGASGSSPPGSAAWAARSRSRR